MSTDALPIGRVVAVGQQVAVAEKAKPLAKRAAGLGTATAKASGNAVTRVARGLATAPAEFKAWRLATEWEPMLDALKAAGDHKGAAVVLDKQRTDQKERAKKIAAVGREVAIVYAGAAWGGWPLATLLLVLVLVAALWLKVKGAMHGAVVMRIAQAAGISLLLTGVATWAGGWAWGWRGLNLLLALAPLAPLALYGIVWAVGATKDDASIGDNLRKGEAGMVPVEVAAPDVPPVVQAVLDVGCLKPGVVPQLVVPGVESKGVIWTAAVDTMGPSATPFLAAKNHAELAAYLGLSTRRLVLTVDAERGSRLHLTGITGQPWAAGRSPLMNLEPVDLWDGIRFGPTLEGDEITYRVLERNSLFGGESGAGKSTALAGIWAAFALSSGSDLYVIDGGEVDTEPLRRSGLATAWTTDVTEGTAILQAVKAEVDRRQHLLAQAELRKVTPEFFAEHGLGFALLLIDELATFTQGGGGERKAFAEALLPILQRARKTGVHVVLSTQSPSVDAIDGDARDIIPVRWCGRARSGDLGNKVLGRGAVGRGLSPANLPDGDDARGVGWYSAPGREVQMRPYGLSDADLRAICARGVDLRKGSARLTAADDDRILATRVADLIRERGVTVPEGRVMLARDVAAVLEMDQAQLRFALGRVGVSTQKVSRPDDMAVHRHAHYVLSDLPATRAV